jgi:Domain of unknown function (DUF5666)
MLKIRLLALLVAAALIVGVRSVSASPSLISTGAPAPDSQPSPTATSSAWNIAGTIQQMNGEFWTLQGFVFRVTAATRIDGDVPSIGTFAAAQGTVGADGTWLATVIKVGSAATPTTTPPPTATALPTATPPPSPLPSPSPTSTATAVPRPPAVVIAPVSTSANQESSENDDRNGENGDQGPSHPPKPAHPANAGKKASHGHGNGNGHGHDD